MEEQELRRILEEQLKRLAEVSKKCEPEHLKDITSSMLNIYTTLNPYQCY